MKPEIALYCCGSFKKPSSTNAAGSIKAVMLDLSLKLCQ